MFVQPLTESWPSAEQPMVPLGTGPSPSGFLSRLRRLTGMVGAGLVTSGMRWVDMDGPHPHGDREIRRLSATTRQKRADGRVSWRLRNLARYLWAAGRSPLGPSIPAGRFLPAKDQLR